MCVLQDGKLGYILYNDQPPEQRLVDDANRSGGHTKGEGLQQDEEGFFLSSFWIPIGFLSSFLLSFFWVPPRFLLVFLWVPPRFLLVSFSAPSGLLLGSFWFPPGFLLNQ